MALPFSKDELAAAVVIIGGGLLGIWKLWLRVKKDHREDSSEEKQHKGYGDLVERVERDAKAAREINASLSKMLDDEITKRRKIEDENDRLKRAYADKCQENEELTDRVSYLEALARAMGGRV